MKKDRRRRSEAHALAMPLSKEDQQCVAFLNMAAIELRRIAEQTPDVGTDVLRIAAQLETEAADMERRFGDSP